MYIKKCHALAVIETDILKYATFNALQIQHSPTQNYLARSKRKKWKTMLSEVVLWTTTITLQLMCIFCNDSSLSVYVYFRLSISIPPKSKILYKAWVIIFWLNILKEYVYCISKPF